MWKKNDSTMIRWGWALLATLAILGAANSLKAQAPSIRLAVIGLSNPSTLTKSNIGNSLVDQLDTQISSVGKYTLLERSALEQLKTELNLGQSDLANAKTFAAKGGLKGADFLLLGKVSQYTYNETVSQKTEFVFGSGFQAVTYFHHIGNVRIDLRVVDVRTGEDVRSVSGQGTASTASRISYQSEWYGYVATDGEGELTNLHSLLTEAANEAVQNAVDQLNEMEPDLASYLANQSVKSEVSDIGGGQILAEIGQGQYVIGVQSTANLKVGDRFQVIAEVPIRNAQGTVVYQEKQNAGTVQITNISESTKALASLVPSQGTTANGPGPAQGDTLVFDAAYGRSLRGMSAPGAEGAAGPSATPPATAAADSATYVRRGDRFMNDKNYSEALDQYKQAQALQPNSGNILARKSLAEMYIGDFDDARPDAAKAVQAGGSLELPIYHNHVFGHSTGQFVIKEGSVSYQPTDDNDGFTVTSKSQIDVSESVYPRTDTPELVVNWRSTDGKNHKYYMVIGMFLTQVIQNAIDRYQTDSDGAQKTGQVDDLVVKLIDQSLQ